MGGRSVAATAAHTLTREGGREGEGGRGADMAEALAMVQQGTVMMIGRRTRKRSGEEEEGGEGGEGEGGCRFEHCGNGCCLGGGSQLWTACSTLHWARELVGI